MYRFLFFLGIIFIPLIFSWWLFVPLVLLFVYLAKLPYEIVLAAFFLDSFYYFGDSIFAKYPLTLFSIVLILLALFLNGRIHWRKVI